MYGLPLSDTELHGSDVGVVGPDAEPSRCCEECSAHAECAGFVLFYGWCYLKGGQLTQATAGGRVGYLMLMPPPSSPPPPGSGRRLSARAGGSGSAAAALAAGDRIIVNPGVLMNNHTEVHFRLSGVPCDTTRAFRVRLVNAMGEGPWSDALRLPDMAQRPMPPTNVRVSRVTAGAIVMRFRLPPAALARRRSGRRLGEVVSVEMPFVTEVRGSDGEPMRVRTLVNVSVCVVGPCTAEELGPNYCDEAGECVASVLTDDIALAPSQAYELAVMIEGDEGVSVPSVGTRFIAPATPPRRPPASATVDGANSSAILVRWAPPNPGLPDVTYRVTATLVAHHSQDFVSGEMVSATVAAPATRLVLTGALRPGGSYAVDVRAVNVHGDGPTVNATLNYTDTDGGDADSESSDLVLLPGPPARPHAPRLAPPLDALVNATYGHLVLAWDPPFDSGVAILGYDVRVVPAESVAAGGDAGDGVTIQAVGDAADEATGMFFELAAAAWSPQLVVRNLRIDHQYSCRVRARNDEGAGAWSDGALLWTAGVALPPSAPPSGPPQPPPMSPPPPPPIGIVLLATLCCLVAMPCVACLRYRIKFNCSRRPLCPTKPPKVLEDDADENDLDTDTAEDTSEASMPTSAAELSIEAERDRVAAFFEDEEFEAGIDDLPHLVVNPVMLSTQKLHKQWEQKEKLALATGAATTRTLGPAAAATSTAATGNPASQRARPGAFGRLHLDISARGDDLGNQNVERLKKLQQFLVRQEGASVEMREVEGQLTEAGQATTSALEVAQTTSTMRQLRKQASFYAAASADARSRAILPKPAALPAPGSR